MKCLIYKLLFLLTVVSYGQNYPFVINNDARQADEDNTLFIPGRSFIYEIANSADTLDEGPKELSITVMTVKRSKKLLKNQTQVAITTNPFNNRIETTGVIENKDNLWLHPPRTGWFKNLALCPFPYVKLPLNEGDIWEDVNVLGEQWLLGSGKNTLRCNMQYEVVNMKTDQIEIATDYWIIRSTMTSEIGGTSATFHFNVNQGFILMEFQTIEGETISFKLKDIVDGDPMTNSEELFFRLRRMND